MLWDGSSVMFPLGSWGVSGLSTSDPLTQMTHIYHYIYIYIYMIRLVTLFNSLFLGYLVLCKKYRGISLTSIMLCYATA